jgi:hypothetical protein
MKLLYRRRLSFSNVMPALVAGIHVFLLRGSGHDG